MSDTHLFQPMGMVARFAGLDQTHIDHNCAASHALGDLVPEEQILDSRAVGYHDNHDIRCGHSLGRGFRDGSANLLERSRLAGAPVPDRHGKTRFEEIKRHRRPHEPGAQKRCIHGSIIRFCSHWR